MSSALSELEATMQTLDSAMQQQMESQLKKHRERQQNVQKQINKLRSIDLSDRDASVVTFSKQGKDPVTAAMSAVNNCETTSPKMKELQGARFHAIQRIFILWIEIEHSQKPIDTLSKKLSDILRLRDTRLKEVDELNSKLKTLKRTHGITSETDEYLSGMGMQHTIVHEFITLNAELNATVGSLQRNERLVSSLREAVKQDHIKTFGRPRLQEHEILAVLLEIKGLKELAALRQPPEEEDAENKEIEEYRRKIANAVPTTLLLSGSHVPSSSATAAAAVSALSSSLASSSSATAAVVSSSSASGSSASAPSADPVVPVKKRPEA